MPKVFGDGPINLPSFLNKLKVEYELNFTALQRICCHPSRATLFRPIQKRGSYKTVDEANTLGVTVVIVEPWGLSFKERTRTLITKLSKCDEEIATFLEEVRKQPKSKVPSWSQVVDPYIKSLYSS